MGPWPSSLWPGQPAGASQGPGASLTQATVDPLEICVKLVGCWSRPCALYLAGARPLRLAATVSTLQPLGQEPGARQQGRHSRSHSTLSDSCVTVGTRGVSDQGRPRHAGPRHHLCRGLATPCKGQGHPTGVSLRLCQVGTSGAAWITAIGVRMSLLSTTLTDPALASVSRIHGALTTLITPSRSCHRCLRPVRISFADVFLVVGMCCLQMIPVQEASLA